MLQKLIKKKLDEYSLEEFYENEFVKLRKESNKYYEKNLQIKYQTHDKLNRYMDILPYKLTMTTTDGKTYNETNYFNGNYILGSNGMVDFLCCQGPLNNTFNDFWKVVLMNNVHTIICK